jgi:hypothetical protein
LIAAWYTKKYRQDMGRFEAAARIVRERVPVGGWVLEVPSGPGYLAIEIPKSGQGHDARHQQVFRAPRGTQGAPW